MGVVIDISHASDSTAQAAIEASKVPCIASHSGCRKLTPHPRNLPDELIKLLGSTGGVIHVPFAKNFVGDHYKNVVNHVDHIIQLVGSDHIGIGSDLDGAVMASGIKDVRDWKRVVMDELNRRGYSDYVIAKIAGGNTLRIFE
jgi:membrane dipeptidase